MKLNKPVSSASFGGALLLASMVSAFAIPGENAEKTEGTANPEAKPAEADEKAILSTIKYPEGMTATLFAREPNVQDPTAITFDEQNRLYIAETHRFDRGVEDNRRNGHWTVDDHALKSTAERLEMYKKHADKKPMSYFTEFSEKIRVIEDRDGDGKADFGQIYADGFNHPLDGTAAGVMALDGKIYFACIPHVWMLEDTDGDLKADKRESLQEGYGISVSLSGHDLNGFALGPDNRIYFTIGDRGYNLKTKDGRHLNAQYEGAAFRMERDGSHLTVIHTGLRNPKEVAFDRYGNLFSVDNNADLGDKARVVDIIEGAHTGWHRCHQAFTHFTNVLGTTGRHTSKWMAEGIWEIDGKNRPAAILKSSGYVSGGPSGLAYNPGIGLSDKWDNHFFICDFVGSRSAVIGFEMEKDGAGYKVASSENFVSGMLCTDVEFGYDGKAYVSDYVGSWPTHGFGNIFSFHDEKALAKKEAKEVKGLFANGFDKLSAERLGALLRHPDMRVRLRAQFALAENVSNRDHFIAATQASEPLTTRLHGLWGLGNLARLKNDTDAATELLKLCSNPEPKVRGQAIKTLSESGHKIGTDAAVKLLNDSDPRTQMLAAIALGKLGGKEHVPALIKLLEKVNDTDEFLRHGAVQGLVQIGDADAIFAFAKSKSPAVRRGIVLAFRRMEEGRIGYFLKDSDLSVAVEAVQAINDRYIESAREQLAEATHLLGKSTWMVDMRILNAMIRVGGDENASRLMKIASDSSYSEKIRSEALWLISRFEKAPPADPTTGKIRPIPNQAKLGKEVKAEIRKALVPLLQTATGTVIVDAIKLAGKFDVEISTEALIGHLTNKKTPQGVRLAAMKKLESQKLPKLVELLVQVTNDEDLKILEAALSTLRNLDKDKALERLEISLSSDNFRRQQVALKLLGSFKHQKAESILLDLLKNINKQELEIQLDILNAAKKQNKPALKKSLAEYEAGIDKSDPLAAYQVTLAGGDAYSGMRVFFRDGAANCRQCHKVGRRGGSIAGPNLGEIGDRQDAKYMLESIIDPSATLTPGYSYIALTMKDGSVVSGLLMKKSKTEVTVKDPGTEKITAYKTVDISNIPQAISPMPPMGAILSKDKIRDLVAYLVSLKEK